MIEPDKSVFFSWLTRGPQEGKVLRAGETERRRGKDHRVLKYLCRMCGIPSCSPTVLFIEIQQKTFVLRGVRAALCRMRERNRVYIAGTRGRACVCVSPYSVCVCTGAAVFLRLLQAGAGAGFGLQYGV